MECSSFILKCEYGGKYFICNRNETWFDKLNNNGVIDWWEIKTSPFLSNCNIQVLEEVKECSNRDLKDQKYLNQLKKAYRELDPDINEDDHICDIVIGKEIMKLKKRMSKRMNELIELEKNAVKYGHGEKFRNIISTDPCMKEWLDLPRYKFPSYEKSGLTNKGLYAYLIVNKNDIKHQLNMEKLKKEKFGMIVNEICRKIDEIYEGLEYPQIEPWDVVRFDKLKVLVFDIDRCFGRSALSEEYSMLRGKHIESIVWSKESHHLEVFYSKDADSYMGTSAELIIDDFVRNHIDILIDLY